MIDHIDYHVTNHCNLNCARCNNFCPLSDPWCVSYNDFCEEWQYVRDKGLRFNEIRILGGETLLHPQIDELLIALRKIFPEPAIVVYTNGIPLGIWKEKLLPIFKECNLTLFVSVYPNLKLNYDELTKGFPKVQKMSMSTFMNTCLHTQPDFDQNHSFSHCNVGSSWRCRALKDYHMYPCSYIPNIPILIKYFPELQDTPLGKADIKESGIDIRTHTIEEIEDFITHSAPFCSFCNAVNARNTTPWGLTERKISEWVEKWIYQ
ncbi:MAG: radical SAM protein [Bacillota bacterium]|nr:radical SAM protein [Bacillota bacterium]